MGKGQELYRKALCLIPGGTQLLSKRPEMFLPGQWPAYYARAKGIEVWDLDGNKYIDATHCGVGGPVLGYGDSEVDGAVTAAVQAGVMCTLNCPEEIELAELLISLHPWAEMVRYTRTGGEALALAVRVARAATGREKISFCGYHGWHDWYLAANLADDQALDGHLLPGLEPAGVPRGLSRTLLPFGYNRIDDLEAIVGEHGSGLAAIVMEPARSAGPQPGFLERVRELATKTGAVLIFDEVTSAWRMNTGGIHLTFGVTPDVAVFAKAIANGYAMGAVIGIRPVMEAAQKTFMSSTNWTERIGPCAALAMIRKHGREQVGAHLAEIGTIVQQGWRNAAHDAGVVISTSGIPPLSHFGFEHEHSAALVTLFNQEMLARGYLASNQFYMTYAHKKDDISRYLQTVRDVFGIVARAIENGDVAQRLKGPVKHTGFHRLT